MANLILSAAGTALGGPVGGLIGGVLGGVADRALVSALAAPTQAGARLSGLELHSTSAGAPMPAVFGRARVAGQTIWAARFKEHRLEQATGGGKGGGARTVSYSYSLSFAVALGEGPIDGIGRIWADGAVMDVSGVALRVHLGGPDQEPDPLIEAVEGAAPAYRNTAYLVFEDLPLDTWGNRPPQLNVEVYRALGADDGLEARLDSVNLIPGAGEFVLSPTPELRVVGEAAYAHENVHNGSGVPDLQRALDQLQAQLPKVDHVNLVVAWFGSDLRCGETRCRPGVENRAKLTRPDIWGVDGLDRSQAHLISTSGGGPAYGGTPSDSTVLACIAELRRRGLAVTLYPFLMMDVAADNALPDPYGASRQAAYPWRGRITGAVAPGRPGSPDGTAAADAQVAAFFGADAADSGGYRRLVMHYARLAAASAGVEGILIGSELRGLTTLRGAGGAYPAVAHLRALAAEVKATVGPGVKVGYSGDWSEWSAHQAPEGGLAFHLDPLWADPNIDFVGVDFYPPLADWRAGGGGVDATAGARGPHDLAYLTANVRGGEDADWYYASPADRAAQARTPITDGAHGEPWVYAAKALEAWWASAHHDRPGGVRSAAPTAWTPRMKPLRLIEFGCPAVDRGSNSPNLFIDPKSSESGLPPGSAGVRDDLAQRRACEAVLAVYGPGGLAAPGLVERCSAWCWDARPYPDFPARADVWADAPDWTLGHWLTGRVGAGGAAAGADILRALLERAGLGPDDYAVEGVAGRASGYVVSGPISTAEALAPLADALGFDAAERGGRVVLTGRDSVVAGVLGPADLALDDAAPDARKLARTLQPTPDLVRVRFLDEADAYQAGSVVRRAARPGGGGPQTLDLPVCMDADAALEAADSRLARALAERDVLTVAVAPGAAHRAEAGDVLRVGGVPGAWRVLRVDLDEDPRLQLAGAPTADDPPVAEPAPVSPVADPRPDPVPQPMGPPALQMLDLPPLEGAETDARPLAAVAAAPWTAYDLLCGPAAAAVVRGRALDPAGVGVTASVLPPGPSHRWDRASSLLVRMAAGSALESRTEAEVLAGANALAVRSGDDGWEVLQFARAELAGEGLFRLSALLRGQLGTEDAMPELGVPVGAAVVRLGPELVRCRTALSERGLPARWTAAPAGRPATDVAAAGVDFTWRGRTWRPWSPSHVRAARTATGARLTWIRRTRVHGDVWDGEVPLGESLERYYVALYEGAHGGYVTSSPLLDVDIPDLTPGPYRLVVEVSQWSDVWGYGGVTHRALWL